MKEVTEWNGHPRWMWGWDNDTDRKEKRYVLCVLTDKEMKESHATYPVRCSDGVGYYHCAEIEEPKKRPCTREELLKMLKKQGLPIIYCRQNDIIYNIAHIEKGKVVLLSPLCGAMPITYKMLCEQYTLLDGTELWVEE